MKSTTRIPLLLAASLTLWACPGESTETEEDAGSTQDSGSSGGEDTGGTDEDAGDDTDEDSGSGGEDDAGGGGDEDMGSGGGDGPVDYKDAILTNTSGDCADHVTMFFADVSDINEMLAYRSDVVITADATSCTITGNNIPNHDFNDESARFATPVSESTKVFTLPREPAFGATPTALTQRQYDAVFLNGVPLDLLSAGCYDPTSPMADQEGNTPIGCNAERDDWMLDPLHPTNTFGTDIHNAHTQPDGTYHYHGNPGALFDDMPGAQGSPVIGFAADGFPIYGSYFVDESGTLRKATSGWTLKPGERPDGAEDPGGAYDGRYIDDWEFTGAGDLDECNGMTVNGQYGYYVTDGYPHVLGCLSGNADPSFDKGPPR